MSLATRLLGANPGVQVSSALSGSLTTPGAKGAFVESSLFHIATVEATGSSSSLEFTSIPQTYTNLMILGSVRVTTGSGGTGLSIRFNSDSGSNYNTLIYQFERSGSSSGTTDLIGSASANKMYSDVAPDSAYSANVFNASIMDIPNYSSTSEYKHLISQAMSPFTTGLTSYQWHFTNGWMSTAAITTITISTNSGQSISGGSSYSLYGAL